MKLNTTLKINLIMGILLMVGHLGLNAAAGYENKFVFVNELPEVIDYMTITSSGTGQGIVVLYFGSNDSVAKSLFPNESNYDITFQIGKKMFAFDKVMLDPQLDPKPKVFIRSRDGKVSLLVGRDYLAK